MKSEPDYFNCSNCDYHCIKDGVHWCGRRDRRIRWDVTMFLCGAYCVCDDIDDLLPDPVPAPSIFPDIVVPEPDPVLPTMQTSLDQWARPKP